MKKKLRAANATSSPAFPQGFLPSDNPTARETDAALQTTDCTDPRERAADLIQGTLKLQKQSEEIPELPFPGQSQKSLFVPLHCCTCSFCRPSPSPCSKPTRAHARPSPRLPPASPVPSAPGWVREAAGTPRWVGSSG